MSDTVLFIYDKQRIKIVGPMRFNLKIKITTVLNDLKHCKFVDNCSKYHIIDMIYNY